MHWQCLRIYIRGAQHQEKTLEVSVIQECFLHLLLYDTTLDRSNSIARAILK